MCWRHAKTRCNADAFVPFSEFVFLWNDQRRGNGVDIIEGKRVQFPHLYKDCPNVDRLPGTWGTPALPRSHPSVWRLQLQVDSGNNQIGTDEDVLCEIGMGTDCALVPDSVLEEARENRYLKSVFPLTRKYLRSLNPVENKINVDVICMYNKEHERIYFLLVETDPVAGKDDVYEVYHCRVGRHMEMWPLVCMKPEVEREGKISVSIAAWNRNNLNFPEDPSVVTLRPIFVKK